jgi:hypothetical protein
MNARQDISILRIENAKFPPLISGDSRQVKVGDDVYVASNPKGLEGSFTKGILSSIRELNRSEKSEDKLDIYIRNLMGKTDGTLIQIDAAISPGSSGGVVVNGQAEAIGIVRSTISEGQNLNFAIPIDQVQQVGLTFDHSILLAGAIAFSDRKRERLQGPVREVVYLDPNSVDQNQVPSGLGRRIPLKKEIYDIDGNLIEESMHDRNGNLTEKYVYEFDENRMNRKLINILANGEKNERVLTPAERIASKINARKFSKVERHGDASWFYNSQGALFLHTKGTLHSSYQHDLVGRELLNIQTNREIPTSRTSYTYKTDRYGNWIMKYSHTQYFSSSGDGDAQTHNELEALREILYFDQQ